MFPSRSSNKAVTAESEAGLFLARVETPLALNRKNPRVVPTQMFASRSRIMERTSACRRGVGTPLRVSFVPFQRTTPLLVPIHNSEFWKARRQLIFQLGHLFGIAESRPYPK